jgi:endonuclease/exonuclease/phosphatase family metal-dependent hydrolase
VFSRHPITRHEVRPFGPERGFIVCRLDAAGPEFTFAAVHTYSRSWRGFEGHRQRTETLVTGLPEIAQANTPLVIMGDFNASPWSPAFQELLHRTTLLDARLGFGLLPTQHGDGAVSRWLWRPIDHCLHSPDVLVRSLRTGPDLGSDHLPLVAELLLPTSAVEAASGGARGGRETAE